jgi:hypothetical protein
VGVESNCPLKRPMTLIQWRKTKEKPQGLEAEMLPWGGAILGGCGRLFSSAGSRLMGTESRRPLGTPSQMVLHTHMTPRESICLCQVSQENRHVSSQGPHHRPSMPKLPEALKGEQTLPILHTGHWSHSPSQALICLTAAAGDSGERGKMTARGSPGRGQGGRNGLDKTERAGPAPTGPQIGRLASLGLIFSSVTQRGGI